MPWGIYILYNSIYQYIVTFPSYRYGGLGLTISQVDMFEKLGGAESHKWIQFLAIETHQTRRLWPHGMAIEAK